ncbi:hypothetical protein IAU60_001584 [Kwoniella sp. DSM 27419]
MTIENGGQPSRPGLITRPSADIRLYRQRASYSLHAAVNLFNASPIAHVAFVHPGDPEGSKGCRTTTLMNIPMVTVVLYDEDLDEDEESSYSVYLHSHRHSGLVEAVNGGSPMVTITTTKVDGIIFAPTAQDHSLNYRSATLHLRDGVVLDDDKDHEEKRSALAAIVDTVTGYERTAVVGPSDDFNTRRTTMIRFKIAAVSSKQRMGGFTSFKEPEVEVPPGKEDHAFTGVVPCWTQWGEPIGYGRDPDVVDNVFKGKSEHERYSSLKAAFANDDQKFDKLGKKRFAYGRQV